MNLKEQIHSAVAQSFEELGVSASPPIVKQAQKREFGHYQVNGVMGADGTNDTNDTIGVSLVLQRCQCVARVNGVIGAPGTNGTNDTSNTIGVSLVLQRCHCVAKVSLCRSSHRCQWQQ